MVFPSGKSLNSIFLLLKIRIFEYNTRILSLSNHCHTFLLPPCGVVLKGRSWSTEEYRYGFQNQEQDNELWEGAVTFKYRVEDARLGRFFSVDPLVNKYLWFSPYAFSENEVIQYVELEGREKKEPSVFKEGQGYSTPKDTNGDTNTDTDVVGKRLKLELENQQTSGFKTRMALYEKMNKNQPELNNDQRSEDGAKAGKEFAEAIGLKQALDIYFDEDIDNKEPLSGWDYFTTIGDVFLEFTFIGKIIPEAAENIVFGSKRGAQPGKKLTSPQARKMAQSLKMSPVSPNKIPKSMQEEVGDNPVFYSEELKSYFSPDTAGHRANNAWKMWDSKGNNRKTVIYTEDNTFVQVSE
jgi:RHS repeat-associated protein